MTLHIESVAIQHSPSWRKWPDTENTDYSEQLAFRWHTIHTREGCEDISVTHRLIPAYLPWVDARCMDQLVPPYPMLPLHANSKIPLPVLDAMIYRLSEASASGCQSLRWYDVRQCWPEVASELPRLFPLRAFVFGDDCPGSTEFRTFPILHGFNVAFLGMWTFDYDSGLTTFDIYRSHKHDLDCRFLGGWESAGLAQTMSECGWSAADKIARIRSGEAFQHELTWVGLASPVMGTRERYELLTSLSSVAPPYPRWLLHGDGPLRDGVLTPWRDHVPCGITVAPLYRESLFGLNSPISSLFNLRTGDLCRTGTVMLAHDKNRELATHGFIPGQHFVPFDGTAQDLLAVVNVWRDKRDELATIAAAARDRYEAFAVEHDPETVYGEVFHDYRDVLRG